jgi:hypothetical protein
MRSLQNQADTNGERSASDTLSSQEEQDSGQSQAIIIVSGLLNSNN